MPRAAMTCRADWVGGLLDAAHAGANDALDDLARRCRPEVLCAARAPFVYARARGRPRETIPAERFHRPYALALSAVELTLHGYCLVRAVGWERRREAVFVVGRPPLWRRLLRRAPPLSLRFGADGGAVSIAVGKARRHGRPDPWRRHILLAPDLQADLLRAHRREIATRAFRSRFAAWMRT
ncbi:hypothetical protein NX784_02540 [Massilia pinisoli]|uniref:Uncharacterized protein n=1 Tax=Massilia pinisoli TaxID=1772194 RepID=A0ABT1ZKN2_9BURK|nr:hypothetical protein [Massilia pinisoli]MCS0580458.1 hypothetical protein [Massilia pinisoli]